MKRAVTGVLVALLATGAVGCGSSSKSHTETSEGIAEPNGLAPGNPNEVRVREANEKLEETVAREKREEEAKEAEKKREESEGPP